MAFIDFVYPDLLTTFGLNEQTVPEMFTGVSAIVPNPTLTTLLPTNIQLATSAHSEAARSIWLVGPVLSVSA
jgi:hypothetical protein